MTQNELMELFQSGPGPHSPAALLKMARAKWGAKAVARDSLEAALKALTDQKRIFEIRSGPKKAGSYTTTAPVELARAELARVLEKQTKQATAAALRVRLTPALRPYFDEALGWLVEEGAAHYLPLGRSRYILNRAPRPSDALDPSSLQALKRVLAKMNRFRTTILPVEELLEWIDRSEEDSPPAQDPAATPGLDEFREWYLEDRRKSSSQMIAVSGTWQHYQDWMTARGAVSISYAFVEQMASLYQKGLIFLEPPERPQDLSAQEQELLIPQTFGPPADHWCWRSLTRA